MKYSKEEQLLTFIKDYLNDNGYPPTVREMCKAVKVSSTSTIFYYLNKLENSNKIKKNPKIDLGFYFNSLVFQPQR